jgi:hypothetical protein
LVVAAISPSDAPPAEFGHSSEPLESVIETWLRPRPFTEPETS